MVNASQFAARLSALLDPFVMMASALLILSLTAELTLSVRATKLAFEGAV